MLMDDIEKKIIKKEKKNKSTRLTRKTRDQIHKSVVTL